jgi:hypothetical protein
MRGSGRLLATRMTALAGCSPAIKVVRSVTG